MTKYHGIEKHVASDRLHRLKEKNLKAAVTAAESARDAKSRKKAADEYGKVFSRRAEFINEDLTGFVGLYLRK